MREQVDERLAAICSVLTIVFALLCFAADVHAEYPFTKAEQHHLMARTAALYPKWPEGRPLPSPGLLWRSPEWFALSRGMTERASWGTIEIGADDVVMNEGLLKHPFLNQDGVRDSLLVHEYTHILQRTLFGPATTCDELALREVEAYAVQRAFLLEEGVRAQINTAPPACHE